MLNSQQDNHNFGNFDLLAIPKRSRLYHLEPLGIGSWQVESLTSYVARLAKAHCVKVGVLAAHELTLANPNFGRSFLQNVSFATRALNGKGRMALDLVQILENLTLREDLRYLTLLSWANVVPSREVLRETFAWCPFCYEEWRNKDEIIYNPLLWAITIISICPIHKQELSMCCPNCRQKPSFLASTSQPGYCSRCNCWLGISTGSLNVKTLNVPDLEWQNWVIQNIGEMLAVAPYLDQVPESKRIPKSLSSCINQIAEGSICEFARKLRINKSSVCQWRSGSVIPRLNSLLQICRSLGLTLQEFLFKPETLSTLSSLPTVSQVSQGKMQSPKKELNVVFLQQSLEASLTEEPPPTLKAVAEKLGYSSRSLRRRLPDLCSKISNRYLTYQKKVREAKIEQACREVQQLAIEFHSKGIDPTRNYMSKHLSKPAYFRDPAVTATLAVTRRDLGLE